MRMLMMCMFVFGNAPWCTVDQAGTAVCGYATYSQCMQVCATDQYCVGCAVNTQE